MDKYSWKVQKASTYSALRKRETYIGNVSETSSKGVMDEGLRKVQKASTDMGLHKRETPSKMSEKVHPTG